MNILYFCLHQKRLKEIVSACQSWHWKLCWRGKRAIRRSCIYFSSTVMFRITLKWKYLRLIFTGNDGRKLSQYVSFFWPMYRSDPPLITDTISVTNWSRYLNPQFEIMPPWRFHCSHSLERSFKFGTLKVYNSKKLALLCTPTRMQLYFLTHLCFTLDLKYSSYEYSFSCSLEW